MVNIGAVANETLCLKMAGTWGGEIVECLESLEQPIQRYMVVLWYR
jgi:hypothetical protein